MRNTLKNIWKIISAPFRFIRWLFKKIYQWLANIVTDILDFFEEEPEDSPLGETLAKTVDAPQELLVHLNALRKHLTRAAIFFGIVAVISFIFSRPLLEFLAAPLPGGADSLIAIEVTEPMGTLMRITLLTAFAISLPYIIFEMFRFIAPGLSVRSRIWGLVGIPVVVIFFLGGMAFAYYIMLPPALEFLTSILGIKTVVRPSAYIGFITSLMFWVGVSFQFPLVIFILAGMGLVNYHTLAKQWRIAIIIIAVISAIITPTIDPLNMALIMGPLIVLYFLSIFLAFIAQRGRE